MRRSIRRMIGVAETPWTTIDTSTVKATVGQSRDESGNGCWPRA